MTDSGTELSNDLFNELSHRAASANVVKNAFLANMSHEMRTPLTVILGFADILRRPSLSEDLRSDYLGRIERSGQQLLNLIEDLLDLSKIEAGQLVIRKEDTDLRKVIRAVLDKHQDQAGQKNLVLDFSVSEDIPNTIQTSPIRLKQILTNLVSNAVKFTEEGSVQISVRQEGPVLSIDVADTGIGICLEKQEELFQPFMQEDNSRTGGKGGTGIGLILAQRLTQLLGGELTLKYSRRGIGTTFSMTLPGVSELKMVQDSKKAELPAQALLGKKILVAEDVLDNQDLFRIVLESAGAVVEIVSNGKEAVDKATGAEFDAILMDVQMPLLDGLSATRQIRAAGAKLPIIALTAHAMPEEVAKSIAAGCDDHVSKPITSRTLISSLLKHLSPKA